MGLEQSIIVRHNVEMGHRLSLQPYSKCFHLHGHSWWVELEIIGPLDDKGMVLGLDFGSVKQEWRGWLDSTFDHHLCLNEEDPLVRLVLSETYQKQALLAEWGIQVMPYDPTVENMARLWGEHAEITYRHLEAKIGIKVQEAATNAATWHSY